MKNIVKQMTLLIIILGVIFVAGCSTQENKQLPNQGNTLQGAMPVEFADLNSTQGLKKFNDVDELKTFLESVQASANQGVDSTATGGIRTTTTGSAKSYDAAAPMTNGAVSESLGAGAADYSHTNVQVQGVDEADFVKNDNRYIYMISGNSLVIIDAADGKDSKIISTTKMDADSSGYNQPTIRNMLLEGNKVVLFVDRYDKALYFERYDIKPVETYKTSTEVMIYDVTDRKNPTLEQSFDVTGSYYDSRMINGTVYVIAQDPLNDIIHYDGPMVTYAKGVIRPEIYYFDNPEQNYQMNTITSINLADDSIVDTKSFMLGYGTTLMVSKNSIYLAYQKQQYWCWGWMCRQYNQDSKDRFMTVIVPLLEGDIKTQIDATISKGLPEDKEWQEISVTLASFYKGLENNNQMQTQYESMFTKIEDKLTEYDLKKAMENSKTIIHKININEGKIEYSGKGEVDGRLLNQFSMDENNGDLRVATTINMWLSKGQVNYNNVYILDGGMNVIGKLEKLAENESIYSTRFMGDKLFMVTYRQIDPFFVIDLSDAAAPKVLGYLKIPGYSSYLHPISDKLIIGVGKETDVNQYGGTITKGLKVSLFDVSDFSNPKEIDKYEIGEQGTDSPVLYDHKAFLYSPTKNILVLPVTEIVSKMKISDYGYRNSIWNGAYVFNVSEKGFTLAGKVKHSSTQTEYYYWFNEASVQRSLYLDNVLYTISTAFVKANDLNDGLAELNTINLPKVDDNINYPAPMSEGVVSVSSGIVK